MHGEKPSYLHKSQTAFFLLSHCIWFPACSELIMSVTARPDQHRDKNQGQPCRDHPPGLCPAPKQSPAGAWCPKKRGDPAFPPLPWPWCHLFPPLLLVGQQPLALGRGRCRAGRPTPRAPKRCWSSGSATGFLGVSPIFLLFFLLGGGFLLPSHFNKLMPPSSLC